MSQCECAEIMASDLTRHFRGCPMRQKYPMHEAEKRDMPGPIVLEFLAWLRSGLPPKLAAQLDEDEALCAAFFAQRIEAKSQQPSFRIQHLEDVVREIKETVCSLNNRTSSNLAGRLDALEKAMILTQGYTCFTCGDDVAVKPNCIANHDVRPHDVVKQLVKRIEKLEEGQKK